MSNQPQLHEKKMKEAFEARVRPLLRARDVSRVHAGAFLGSVNETNPAQTPQTDLCQAPSRDRGGRRPAFLEVQS